MDNGSRNQEVEISRSRQRSYKSVQRARVIIVDDFGGMKSGEYLKFLVKFLSIITIICIIAGALFYYFYTGLSLEADLTKERLVLSEKRVIELTREKELLVARLVMSGKDPVIDKKNKQENSFSPARVEEKDPVLPMPEEEDKITLSLQAGVKNINRNIQLNGAGDSPENMFEKKVPRMIEKAVDLEKFTVTKDGATGDLLVRFDIRNISKTAKDVSGRIFIVLKPDNDFEEQWLVVPKSAIKGGIPSEYRKGQYFSISNFKPVKFRINHPGDSEFYKKASVFVFNEQEDLIFEKLINITESVE